MYQHISLTFKVSLCFCSPTKTRVVHIGEASDKTPQLLQKPQHFPSLKSELGKAFEMEFLACSTETVRISFLFSSQLLFLKPKEESEKNVICFCNPGNYWYSEARLRCFPSESEKEPKQF